MDCTVEVNVTNGSTWDLNMIVVLEELLITASFISLILNAFVIIILVYARQYRRPFAVLLCSLAVSDLITSSTSVFVSIQTTLHPTNSVVTTDVPLPVYALLTIGILSGTYDMLTIGIERYLTVCDIRKRRIQLKKRILKILGVSWTLALALGSLPLFGWNCANSGETSTLYGPLCMNYLLFVVVPNTAIIFSVLLITYTAMILKLRELNSATTIHAISYAQTETRVTRTALTIWVLAIASYTPFLAGVLWDASHRSCPEKLKTSVIVYKNVAYAFLVLNSIGNPIVYTFNCPNIWRLLRLIRGKRRNRVNVDINTVAERRMF
ncbi:lysophosphatidic acid receptor 3-like [Brachyhypopomus gauderio]|uniref:lysophosphatidic acid receptor 3-like n=1 Tax=Brachyhypopomus gauderio TaxID=698409 RepID=UPI004041E61E